MCAFFWVLLYCVGRGVIVQGLLPVCLDGFIVSEVNSESEWVRRANS
jgi:hypothetical protein